ncbi:MAG: MBL fold metallo-hydrolase, partial [Oscillospiraceae bacterium]|nr:MBL fold metallo-hydrolase [Oscillospiraceae bacterium]
MKISAVKLYDKGYMLQPFAFGGEDGPEAFDPAVRYRSSLQNFVIDTGDEVILVDTGMPKEVPQAVPDAATLIFMGIKGDDYVDALKKLGYEPEQISKILITHKHADHIGELRNFPNAKIYASVEECETEELLHYPNLVPVAFCKKGYENFPAAEKIAEGVWFVQAKGHTAGNSIVIVEDGELYYMIHGDVTYTDEALYENKLSVVYEDLAAARETLDRVRDFIRSHPTVY